MPEIYISHNSVICGCDEAGRGCLAGPVVAAAVILPPNYHHPLLNDSKQVRAEDRQLLAAHIRQHALAHAIGVADHIEIDRINILKASFLAMHRALDALDIMPDCILVDGNRFLRYKNIRHECHIKGDGKFAQIAAASILAKTYRDQLMEQLHEELPQYGWRNNKGYPTPDHRKAILKYGPSAYHRKTFRLLGDDQLNLFTDE